MRHMFHAKALLISNLMAFLFAYKTVVIFGLHASRDLLLCNTDLWSRFGVDAYRQKLVDVGLALLSLGVSTETLSLLLLPRLLKVSTPCSQYVAGGEGYSLRSFIITNVAAVSTTAKIPLPLNLSGRLHQIGNCFVKYGSL